MPFTLTLFSYYKRQILVALFFLVTTQHATASCTVASTGLNFGKYDVFQQSHTDYTGSLDISCDTATSYTLKLNSGHGTVSDRFMLYDSYQLHYNLYVDASRTMIWGDGTSGHSTLSGSTSSTQTHTIYGRIFSEQNVKVGDYQDAVIVTIEF